MRDTKKIITKQLFEATYVASNTEEIKKLKSSGVVTPQDVVKLSTDQKPGVSENDEEDYEKTSREVEHGVNPYNEPDIKIDEPKSNSNLIYVEYLSDMKGENPFNIHGDRYEYVWARYPGNKRDVGVYKFSNDLVLSFDWFKKNILKQVVDNDDYEKTSREVEHGINPYNEPDEKINELDSTVDAEDIDIPKLQHDVDVLVSKIENVFGDYLKKIDKPIEQAQFITAIADKVGVPVEKLTTILSTLKKISMTPKKPLNAQTNSDLQENVKYKITKTELIKSIKDIK